jgi:hypothetical protein
VRANFSFSDETSPNGAIVGVEAHGKRGKSGCGVYLPDLEQPRPPDAPPGMVKLRLVKKG